MASARSKVLNFLTRIAMWLIFRSRKHPSEYRSTMQGLDLKARKPLPQGIMWEEVKVPVPGRAITNQNACSGQIILYLHGGAFIMRLPHGHTALVASLCDQAQCSALMVWYRLAPEHAYPAAPDDCLAAYRALLDAGHKPQDIVIMGDSAGGNLTLALLHLIRNADLEMPSGAIALSPITDFAQISATWRLNKWRDPMYRVQGFVNPVEYYLQGADPVDPVVSPYYGDYSGFPPIFLMVGGVEALLDDSVGMVRKAIEQGVPAKLQIWQGMPHVFVLQDMLPETRLAKKEIANWLRILRESSPTQLPLYSSCVEVFNLKPFSGVLQRETNDVFLSGYLVAAKPISAEAGG